MITTTLTNTITKINAMRAYDNLLSNMAQEFIKAGRDTDRLIYLHTYSEVQTKKIADHFGVSVKQLSRDWENWLIGGKK